VNKDSLIVKLMRAKGWTLQEAEEFVADLPDDAPIYQPEDAISVRDVGPWRAGDTALVRRAAGTGDSAVSARFIMAQRNPDGTTALQRAALDRGVALCPNCHEGVDNHAPGCSRGGETPMNPRAVTKGTLPPLS
jgi:hypothetical protein